jgi:hypothetical protein
LSNPDKQDTDDFVHFANADLNVSVHYIKRLTKEVDHVETSIPSLSFALALCSLAMFVAKWREWISSMVGASAAATGTLSVRLKFWHFQ